MFTCTPAHRMSLQGRFLSCLFLLVFLVCIAVPRASQAQISPPGGGPPGGGPPGGGAAPQGSWRIEVSYTGVAQTTLSENVAQGNVLIPGNFSASVEGINLPSNGMTSIGSGINAPPSTGTGGITGVLTASLNYSGTADFSQTGQASLNLSGAKMLFKVLWQPLNGDWSNHPAPPVVVVCMRRKVTSSSLASFVPIGQSAEGNNPPGSGSATINAMGTMAGLSMTASSTAPPAASQTTSTPDETFVSQELNVSGGVAQIQFDVNTAISISMANEWTQAQYNVRGSTAVLMDFCVAGFDLGRFGSKLNGTSGGHTEQSQDPSFTRWLPLAFSPTISSQPFRNQPGALPAPWGNIACAYSISMQREPNPPNQDLDGQSQIFVPTGPYGNFNAPAAPYTPLPGGFVPYYAITDANGDRLVFDKKWNAYGDIHSNVSYLAGRLTVSAAGPPGALK